MTRRVQSLLVVVAVAIALSGCSIASQKTAVTLPSSLRLTSSTTTSVPISTPSSQLSVYFLQNTRLVAVPVYYAADPVPYALAALGRGPTVAQAQRGITTAFSNQPALILIAGVVPKGGVASVEVDTSFLNLPELALEQASAQIVYTLTGLPNGPNSVRFVLDGQKLESLIPPGKLVNRAVSRLDYCEFAPLDYTPCAHLASPT